MALILTTNKQLLIMLRYYDKMGKMTIVQRENRKFTIDIYTANCMAAFVHETTNENGNKAHTLYMFFVDARHARNIQKEMGDLFGDEVVSIELNLAYKEALSLLMVLTKVGGYKVTTYYQQPNNK